MKGIQIKELIIDNISSMNKIQEMEILIQMFHTLKNNMNHLILQDMF